MLCIFNLKQITLKPVRWISCTISKSAKFYKFWKKITNIISKHWYKLIFKFDVQLILLLKINDSNIWELDWIHVGKLQMNCHLCKKWAVSNGISDIHCPRLQCALNQCCIFPIICIAQWGYVNAYASYNEHAAKYWARGVNDAVFSPNEEADNEKHAYW